MYVCMCVCYIRKYVRTYVYYMYVYVCVCMCVKTVIGNQRQRVATSLFANAIWDLAWWSFSRRQTPTPTRTAGGIISRTAAAADCVHRVSRADRIGTQPWNQWQQRWDPPIIDWALNLTLMIKHPSNEPPAFPLTACPIHDTWHEFPWLQAWRWYNQSTVHAHPGTR